MGIITEDKTPSRNDGGAFFVFSPRNADDFNQPFPLDKIQPYRIIGCIALNGMDYGGYIKCAACYDYREVSEDEVQV